MITVVLSSTGGVGFGLALSSSSNGVTTTASLSSISCSWLARLLASADSRNGVRAVCVIFVVIFVVVCVVVVVGVGNFLASAAIAGVDGVGFACDIFAGVVCSAGVGLYVLAVLLVLLLLLAAVLVLVFLLLLSLRRRCHLRRLHYLQCLVVH